MARPARLTTNRHGTYTVRWIVPVAMRGPDGKPREIRVSLRTRDLGRARIAALQFNLALERLRVHMGNDNHHDPLLGLSRLMITAGNLKVDIKDDQDRRLFQNILRDDAGVRDAVLQAIRSGAAPTGLVGALLPEAKAAVAAGVANPVLVKDAIDLFIQTRTTLGANRRTTAGEKQRTMELLLQYLAEHGHDMQSLQVHEVRRDHLLDFVTDYATRPAKSAAAAQARRDEQAGAGSPGQETALDTKKSGRPTKTKLSPPTVSKAVGHLSDFYVYATGKNWIGASPLDGAFLKATESLRTRPAKLKRAASYDMFSLDEVKTVFEPTAYLRRMKAADEFWVPLIALYTGARLGEICQLETSSVLEQPESDLFLIDIKERLEEFERDDPATKNLNSVRRVPVAQQLIDLGFIEYHRHVRDLGARVLFPHRPINQTRLDDPGKLVGRSFGEHLDLVGISSPKKVFHSLRHTVITHLHVNHVPLGDAELIVGHASQDRYKWLSGASAAGGTSETHIGTYVNAGQYKSAEHGLEARMKRHLDHALRHGLDFAGLREAARIVQEHTVRNQDGSFASGWHTNNKAKTQAMLDRLAERRAAINVNESPRAQPG